jgi:peptide/nickel transport system substrate-binding protein
MATKNYWNRMQQQRVSRRQMLAVTGAGAAGLAVAAACGGGGGGDDNKTPSADNTPSSGTPVAGGTYRYPVTGDWGTINPLTSVSFGPGILPKMYNALVIRSTKQPDQEYLDLAESYEQPDDVTYLFTLRTGVKIGPNTLGIEERDLDSSDCIAWLDAINASGTAVAKRFTDLWLATYEAASPTEFTMVTSQPYAYFFFTLNTPVGGCMPPKEMLEMDMNAQGVGAGPFILDASTFVETGGAELNRNPNYYRTDPDNGDAALPYVDKIVASRITDRQPRRTAFIDGQIDSYDPETIAEVEQLQGQISGLTVFEEPANTFIAFTMNPTKAPWDNDDVRRAANLALNRQQYVDVIVQGAGQPNGLVHWPLGAYALPPEELETLQPFDPEQSRQLLQDAGFSVPLSVKVMYPANSDIEFHNKHLPIWLEQMSAAGFQVDEDPQEFTNWLQNYTDVNYDASFSLNQIYETPEAPLDFHHSQGPTSDGNFAIGVGELYPEVDEAIEASKSSVNAEEQLQLVLDAQRLIYEKAPAFLPIMSWTDYTVRQPKIKNWPSGLGTAFELYLNTAYIEA